jgi:hypothetical protein
MERRVNSVQLRSINLLTSGQVAAIVAGDGSLDPGPDSIAGLSAPNQYKRITEGYYYSNRLTGGSPKVELYFSAATGLAADKTIRISGIHQLDDSGTAVEFRVSDDYKTLLVDTPPWEERESFNNSRHTPDENVSNTALFDVTFGNEYSSRKSLIVSREITFSEATTTTAKLTFNSTNYFKAGDVVYVDVPSTSPFFGLDGLFRVKEAGSNYITYDFSTELEEPINSIGVLGNRSVYAVARSATRDGATWINTSTNPDTVFVWSDIRWVTYRGDVTDEVAPGPVTNLEATSENDTPDGNAIGLSRVTLTWSAPDINSDDTPIDDLVGYTIWWRQYATQEWQKTDITGADTTFSVGGFEQGSAAYFRVFARDASSNRSTGVDITHTTGRSTPVIGRPGPPVVETYLGTIKVSYDDLTALGNVQSGTAKEVQVYFSTVDDFDIESPGAYYGKFAAGNKSFIIIPGNELVHDTDYYFKINVRDIYGNVTLPSAQVSVRAQLEDIVTFNMLEVGSLEGQTITGLQIQTNENPGVNGGIILTQQQLIAYAPPGNVGGSASQTFRIDAATGAVSIGEYLGKQEAAGFYLGKDDAKTEYTTKIEAGAIELKATNAAQSAADAQTTADESITRIEAGNITITKAGAVAAINDGVDPGNTTTINGGAIKTNTIDAQTIKAGTLRSGVVYAGEINADKITAGSISADRLTTTSLNANNITAGTIASDRITTQSISAAKINADNINAGTLSGNRITGGTITGTTVQTSSGTKRVVLNNSLNAIQFYYNGTLAGQIDGQSSAGANIEISGPGTAGLTVGTAATTFNGGITTIGTGNIIASGRCGQGTFSALGVSGSAVFRAPGGANAFQFGPSSSDVRLKKDIVELENSLDLINNLRPVKFRFKAEEDGPVNYGLIAQEVQPLFDDNDNVVNSYPVGEDEEDKEEYLSVEYNAFIAPLIGAIKELTQKNLELEARLANLENS